MISLYHILITLLWTLCQISIFKLQVVEWGLAMMINGAQRLREAERTAKQTRLGIWRNHVPPASAGTKLSGRFHGHVTEIVTGDTVVVCDAATGATVDSWFCVIVDFCMLELGEWGSQETHKRRCGEEGDAVEHTGAQAGPAG